MSLLNSHLEPGFTIYGSWINTSRYRKEIKTMINVGIDIAKFKHIFSIYDTNTGQVIEEGIAFSNDLDGFMKFLSHIEDYSKAKLAR